MSDKNQQIYDLANSLYNYLENSDRSVNVEGIEDVFFEEQMGKGVIVIRVDGDWKHDHLRADYLTREFFNKNDAWELVDVSEEEVGETDSDWGTNDHYYVVKPKSDSEPIVESKQRPTRKQRLTEDNLNPYWRKEAKKQYKQYDQEFSAKKKEIDDLIDILKKDSTVERGAVDKFERKMKELLPQFKFDDYGDDIEKEQYPYYVTLYNKTAVYEPAEGGYYVEVQYPAYSDGYSTYEDAKADMEDYVASDSESWHKVDEDAYEWTGKYIGDGQYIRIETDKSYLKAVKTYDGYESFGKRVKTIARPRKLSEGKSKTAKPNLNEQMARKARLYGRR